MIALNPDTHIDCTDACLPCVDAVVSGYRSHIELEPDELDRPGPRDLHLPARRMEVRDWAVRKGVCGHSSERARRDARQPTQGQRPWCSLRVDDLEAALERVRELGGEVEEIAVEGDEASIARFGRFKLCRDTRARPSDCTSRRAPPDHASAT